jgi:hypothetical protein
MTISATTRGLRPGVCTSSTRPVSPFDGQLIYETDTNRVAVYDTNAWVYKTPASTTGSVLQVVSASKTDSFTTTSITFVDVTGVSTSITPSSASNKIFVVVSGVAGNNNASQPTMVNLVRDSTNIAQSTGGVTTNQTQTIFTNNTSSSSGFTVSFLDSPNTTSATTYKLQARAASNTSYIGRYAADNNSPSITTITVMEIAG